MTNFDKNGPSIFIVEIGYSLIVVERKIKLLYIKFYIIL